MQKNIEFHSNAMLDTEELMAAIRESFPSGLAAAESVDLFLRSDHEQLINIVIQNLYNLKQLISLNILANEGFKTFENGLEIRNDTLQRLKLSFYQSTPCHVLVPKLTSLNLVVRHMNDINLLKSICEQLRELTINFQSKELVPKLFLCNFKNLIKLRLAIENDKYLPYTISPTNISWQGTQIFLDTIKDLKYLEIIDKCNMIRHNYLKVFASAESLSHLTINYIILDSSMVEFISNFRKLRYLNLRGCSTAGESIVLDLPSLQELLMPYKHYSTLPCTNLHQLTTLSYSSSQKNHAQFLQQIAERFTNLTTLNLLNFDYELSCESFLFLNRLQSLHTLTIRDMSVSNYLFTHCPTLQSLQKLVLHTIVTEISLVKAIPEKFPRLYKLNIDNCFFYVFTRENFKNHITFDHLKHRMPLCRISTVGSTVFTNEQYDETPSILRIEKNVDP
ncbi:uncharacterized protein LOC131437851 isoform X2 [Malaya genurostris]|nr:uncharacterized protein LOC131437851 isoform X2 [Malaya genurostris]